MKISNIIFIPCILLIAACSGNSSSESTVVTDSTTAESLKKQVLAIHDEVMPKMNDVYKLQQELKEKLKNSTTLTENDKEEITSKIHQLDSANNTMMVWMRQFVIPDSLDEAAMKAYYHEQMEKVERVKKEMEEAIEEAKK